MSHCFRAFHINAASKPLSHLRSLYNVNVTYGFTKSHILFIGEAGRVHIDLVSSFIFNFLLVQFESYLFQTEVDCDVVSNLTAEIRAWDLNKNSL